MRKTRHFYDVSLIIQLKEFNIDTVFSVAAMSREQTIKEGYLYKRGKINTDWKQRLFILNGKQLAYFKGSVSVLVRLA